MLALLSAGIFLFSFFFFFNDTATTEIYTLSLHDALPICTARRRPVRCPPRCRGDRVQHVPPPAREDRKSTRLNSSHTVISYAVFCLKKKKKNNKRTWRPDDLLTAVLEAQTLLQGMLLCAT